jgi:hypothetical protein
MCDCEDEKIVEQLPPETTVGANTFGCLVEGNVWRDKMGFPYSSLSIPQLSENWLIIEAKRMNDESSSGFYLVIKTNSINTGKYELNTSTCYIDYSETLNVNNKTCIWSKEESNFIEAVGFIQLTRFDVLNGVVSGKFEAILTNSDCGIINITSGRFDLKK